MGDSPLLGLVERLSLDMGLAERLSLDMGLDERLLPNLGGENTYKPRQVFLPENASMRSQN